MTTHKQDSLSDGMTYEKLNFDNAAKNFGQAELGIPPSARRGLF
jgi:hypothetical protein